MQPSVRYLVYTLVTLFCAFSIAAEQTAINGCIGLLSAESNSRSNYRIYKSQGANLTEKGTVFGLWAPNAQEVEVLLETEEWKQGLHKMRKDAATGIWSIEFSERLKDVKYKYRILDANGNVQFRNDPVARYLVRNEATGVWNSVVVDPNSYQWNDTDFQPPAKPRIMEVNPRTRVPHDKDVNFRRLAQHLLPILKNSGINTVSLMPVSHHNVVESWGYQPGGIFAVNYRHGHPDDLKYFVDTMHTNGIAVIFDVVLGHASKDWDTGLGGFDGTQLYFPAESHLAEHRDWGTYIYDFGRPEVRQFLISNVKYWAEEFHIDGVRVDGVTSMLYRDYSRPQDEVEKIWAQFGTNKNHDAVEFFKIFNTEMKNDFPGFLTIAEESSGWPGITHPVSQDGLGFDYMWGMGGMHHMRSFLKTHPQDRNLFEILAPNEWNESYVHYVNSHDETAHGKNRYIEQINDATGTDMKFEMARVVTTWMYGMRGIPMIFQGDEIAETRGWNHNLEVQEFLADYPLHSKFQNYLHDLGKLHEAEPAFSLNDKSSFAVLNVDNGNKILTLLRKAPLPQDDIILILHFGNNLVNGYKTPSPYSTEWTMALNSDASAYGGFDRPVELKTVAEPMYGQEFSLKLSQVHPKTAIILKRVERN